ncbi:MAG TPA: hypothetical protein VLE97_11645 [Gaiellaceae bacterium]|nr:hypothetical protein [Gaiellaceae bacterium]
MTNSEADALIASLPQPGNLRLYRDGDRIVMDGGKWGPHLISVGVSSAERLLTHWKGYVENQGLSLGPGYSRLLPLGSSQERDYQPGDRVAFSSASYSAAGGWRPGIVVRATPKRVLVEFSYKGEIEEARRKGRKPRRHQMWRKRNEVRRP